MYQVWNVGVTFVLSIQSISQILINSLSLTVRDSVTVQHHFLALFASFVTYIPFLRVSYFLYLLFSISQVSTFIIWVKIRVQMTRTIVNSTFMMSRNYLNNNSDMENCANVPFALENYSMVHFDKKSETSKRSVLSIFPLKFRAIWQNIYYQKDKIYL